VLLSGYISLVIVAAAGLTVPVTETEIRPIRIDIDAPEGCSGADAFFGSLRSRTDRVRQAEGNEPQTTLQVRLTRVRGRVVGELRIVDSGGGTDTRKVQGENCEDVVQALSLTAALALDPSARLTAPATAPATVAASAATPATIPVPAAKPTATPTPAARPVEEVEKAAHPSPRMPTVEFGGGPVGLGVLSEKLSPGVTLSVRKTLGGDGGFHPTLGLAIVYARNDLLPSQHIAQAALASFVGTFCPLRWTAGVFTFQPCAMVLAGWLSASGHHLSQANTVDRLWTSVGGSARTALYVGGGVAIELETGISAPIPKRKFFVTIPGNVVAETPTISPVVSVALTYAL
jgi:hypothetical protein